MQRMKIQNPHSSNGFARKDQLALAVVGSMIKTKASHFIACLDRELLVFQT
jgi:hypothetical protein